MGNKYRTQQKINKDKQRRLLQREKRLKEIVDYDCIYNVTVYLAAYYDSLKGVKWKSDVQRNMTSPLDGLMEIICRYENGNLEIPLNAARETIRERGKPRQIVPIKFQERVREHVLCDNILLPLFKDLLIYANGASLKGKGTDFTRSLMDKYIYRAVKEGYTEAVQFDIHNYFGSIPYQTVYDILSKHVKDETVLTILMNIVLSFEHGNLKIKLDNGEITKTEYNKQIEDLYNYKGCGVCLGSQVSQILALVVLNDLDHYIKDTLHMKYYIRYMDDGVILCKTKEEAALALKLIYKRIEKVGLSFSEKKTKIVKLTKGFTFLKVNYRVVDNKVIKTLHRSSVIRMRRKLKKFDGHVKSGAMKEEDVFNSLQSWWSHSFVASAYRTRKEMLAIYKEHFTYRVDFFEARLETMNPPLPPREQCVI